MHRSLPAGIKRWTTRSEWAGLIAAAPQHEIGQAWVRLAISIAVLLYAILVLRGLHRALSASRPFWFIVGFTLFATTTALWILAVPRPFPLRRMLGIAGDNAAITYAMLGLGEGGAVLFGAYLFVAFGNGFRYGRFYLYLAQGFALVGHIAVMTISDFWSKHLSIGMGLLVMLIVLPFYIGALAHRMQARHLTTEGAQRMPGAGTANLKAPSPRRFQAVRSASLPV